MFGSLPSPGPTIQMFIALLHAIIFCIQIYGTWITPYGNKQDYSSETKIGCTIIYGEYVFIGNAEALLQKMCPKSPPTLSADTAE